MEAHEPAANNETSRFESWRPGEWSSNAWLAAILIVAAIVYIPSLDNRFVLDDRFQILGNPYLGDWSFVWKSMVNDLWWYHNPRHLPVAPYYRPFHNIWLALNFHLFGLRPAPWHAAIIGLHLIVVWLTYRVAAILSGNAWIGLLTAALFAAMPIHAQAIGWIAAIATPLSAAFQLAAFEYYLRSRDGSRRELALSLGLFAGALLSYDAAVVFPALIAAYAFIFPSPAHFAGEGNPKRGGSGAGAEAKIDSPISSRAGAGAASAMPRHVRNAIAATWPYALTMAAYIGLRYWVLGFIVRPAAENPAGMTMGTIAFTIPGAIAIYLSLLAMPWRANIAHRLVLVWNAATPQFFLPLIGLCFGAAAAFLLVRRNPRRRLYLFYAAWVFVPLLPAFDLKAIVAQAAIQDRYLYLPSFGFCLLVADLALNLAEQSRRKSNAVLIGAAVVIVTYLGSLIRVQGFWHDDTAWYSRCVTETPASAACHRGLGMALVEDGDFPRARRELERAARLGSDNASDLYTLALVDGRIGDSRAAETRMREWLRLLGHPTAGDYARFVLFADAAGDTRASGIALKRAELLPGGIESAAIARARISFRHGNRGGAEARMRDLVQHAPNNASALSALGEMLNDERRYSGALPFLRRALSADPANAGLRYQAALALHNLGRDNEARKECAAAMAAAPFDPSPIALMNEINHRSK
ncbi:MAG: tetratricopeptide repeat protein [Candidatus Binataceae bacterium]